MNFFKGIKGVVKGVKEVREESRSPIAIIYFGDQSGSMLGETKIINDDGEMVYIPKIEQMTEGFKNTQKSLLRFQKENTRYYVKYQYIEVNTYSKALFPTFERIDDPNYNLAEVNFSAGGVTNVEAAFESAKQFLNSKHLPHHHHKIPLIMISDGVPTDINGYALSEEQYKKVVDEFKKYLVDHGYDRYCAFYFIAIGEEAEPFGRYYAGENFYKLGECESIADIIPLTTYESLVDVTSINTDYSEYDEDEYTEEDDVYDFDDEIEVDSHDDGFIEDDSCEYHQNADADWLLIQDKKNVTPVKQNDDKPDDEGGNAGEGLSSIFDDIVDV